MTDKPIVTQCGAYKLEMEPGTYLWCACGRSATQPFCDGSHQGTSFTPLEVEITEKRRYGWCGCRASLKGSMCDGAHKKIAPVILEEQNR